jgi:hypothetical protein
VFVPVLLVTTRRVIVSVAEGTVVRIGAAFDGKGPFEY